MRLFQERKAEFSHGVSRCVVYQEDFATVWPGIVSIEDTFDIREAPIVYVDGSKRRTFIQGSDYQTKVTSYSFPDEILDEPFGMCYRVDSSETGEFELHFVYNCYAELKSTVHQTVTNEVAIPGFVVDISTKPVDTVNFTNPLSHIIVRTRGIWTQAVDHLEDIIYGTTSEPPRLPTIDEIIDILELYVWLKITDNGNGTWDAEEMNGATDIIEMVSETEFAIDWASANYIQEQTYNIHSL